MPRLIGRRTESDSYFALLFALALTIGILLEYFGYINVISGFGRNQPYHPNLENNELPR